MPKIGERLFEFTKAPFSKNRYAIITNDAIKLLSKNGHRLGKLFPQQKKEGAACFIEKSGKVSFIEKVGHVSTGINKGV